MKEVKIKNQTGIYAYKGNLYVKWETDLDGDTTKTSNNWANLEWAERWRYGDHVYSDQTRTSQTTPPGNMLYSPLINTQVKAILITGNNNNTTSAFELMEIIVSPA